MTLASLNSRGSESVGTTGRGMRGQVDVIRRETGESKGGSTAKRERRFLGLDIHVSERIHPLIHLNIRQGSRDLEDIQLSVKISTRENITGLTGVTFIIPYLASFEGSFAVPSSLPLYRP